MIVSPFRRFVWHNRRNLRIISYCVGKHVKRTVNVPLKLNVNEHCGDGGLSRFYSSKESLNDKYDDYCELEDTNYVFQKLSRKENIQRLIDCMGCTENEAASMQRDNPKLKLISSSEIEKKLQFLSENGIQVSNVVENPWLLTYKTNFIDLKLNVLKQLGAHNIHLALPLLRVPLKRLKDIKTWSSAGVVPDQKERVAFLSEKLQCDPADIAYAVTVHRFVQTLPFDRLVTVIEILLEAGVPPENILKDIWVIRYKKDQVLDRIERAKESGVEQFKPWMVRCTEKTFSNTLRIKSEKRLLLGPHNDSTVNYVSSRLGCSNEEAVAMLSRHPQLRGIGAAKLCNTLDFLLGKEGQDSADDKEVTANFDRLQVWTSSRALCHSLETMKTRLARLRALGYEPWTPAILYKSKHRFEEFIRKLEEKKNSAEDEPQLETKDVTLNKNSFWDTLVSLKNGFKEKKKC